MPKKRGPGGVPIDIPSVNPPPEKERDRRGGGNNGDVPTDSPIAGKGGIFPEEPPTIPSYSKRRGGADDGLDTDGHGEPETVIHGGRRPQGDGENAADDGQADPVAGWLVVVAGKGRGNFVKIGHGLNSIGRGPYCRVRLDYGDREISRSNHAFITYDPRGRTFYVQHGDGKNLVYLDEQPVLAPTALESGSEIAMGQTRLRFVALCGPDFSWASE